MLKKPATIPVHMLPISELYLASEAPKGLDLQVRDSGRGSPLTDAELKTSIYNNGVILPLIWKEEAGKKYVVAGNRRLRFLREIFADAMATEVRTQNVADFPGDWRDVAMDTNIALPPHIVERFEMIDKIARAEKLKPAEVCARYGLSDGQYRRVMALAGMAPVVRQAWKDAKIDAKTAQTFTLEPDPKEQERIFNALHKNSGRVTDWMVRERIVPHTQQEVGRLVAFVGLDTVKQAKLLKQEDLFENVNHTVTDIKGLKKLVGDRFAKVRDELLKQGWSWVLRYDELQGNEYQYGDVHPDPKKAKPTAEEKARGEEIEKLLGSELEDSNEEDALMEEAEILQQTVQSRGYSDAQKAKSGCILKIGHKGELLITYGKVKPEERKKAAAEERRASAPAKKAAKPKKPGEVVLTNALAGRLSQLLEKSISESMKAAPYVSIAAMIAGFATHGEVVNVDVGKEGGSPNYRQRNDVSKNFLTFFEGALKSSPEQQARMLANVASEALDIQVSFTAHKQPVDNQGLQMLIAHLPKEVVVKTIAANFDAADYFGSIDIRSITEAVRAGLGDDHAAKVAKMRRVDAAKYAVANLVSTGYLPPALRTAHYTGPVEKKAEKAPAKKAAKKAPKKKAKK